MDRAICEKEQKMKHFEEHSLEEILNLSPEGYTNPAVVDGKLVRCEGTKCTDCDLSCRHTGFGRLCTLHFIEWLYSEVQEDTSEGNPVNPPEKRGRRTRWIPITERSPEMYEIVIVTTSTNAVTTAFMTNNRRWIYIEGTERLFKAVVTAWMPLPKPYKGESEDEKADNRRVCKGNAQQKGEVMTNEEKNKKRFDELELGELSTDGIASFIAVGKDGEINTCTKITCKDCIFVGRCYGAALEWLKSEAEPDKTEPSQEEKMEKVDRLMLEAMEIANENSIPYIAATESRSILAGGTPKELLALSVYQEVQIAKGIRLPMEDLIRNVTRGIEIAYRAFEEFGEERK